MNVDKPVRTITPNRVRSAGPCWSSRRIDNWFHGRKRVKTLEALEDTRIPIPDRIWLGLQFLPSGTHKIFALLCVREYLGHLDVRASSPREVEAIALARDLCARAESGDLVSRSSVEKVDYEVNRWLLYIVHYASKTIVTSSIGYLAYERLLSIMSGVPVPIRRRLLAHITSYFREDQ